MNVEVDTSKARKDFIKGFASYKKENVHKATSHALNDVAGSSRTMVTHEIYSKFNIKTKKEIREVVRVTKAHRRQAIPEARVKAKSPYYGVKNFEPIQEEKGVSVKIKRGSRKLIKSAFIARMPNPRDPTNRHQGVFARGEYRGGKFQWRRHRERPTGENDLKIYELTTLGISAMMRNSTVVRHMQAHVDLQLPGRLEHHMDRLARGIGK